jgi:hypothetical protein
MLSVQVVEIGGDRLGETAPSRNRALPKFVAGLNSPGVGSSGATFVPMMKPAHLGESRRFARLLALGPGVTLAYPSASLGACGFDDSSPRIFGDGDTSWLH